MNTSTNFDNDREFKLLLNQLILGSAIGAAFLAVVYIGGPIGTPDKWLLLIFI